MDFVNKLSGNSNNTQAQQPAAGGQAQSQDYGDKAANFLDKKFNGGKVGEGNMEKVTDGARSAYEKVTGSKVDPKYSN